MSLLNPENFINTKSPSLKEVEEEDSLSTILKGKPLEKIYKETPSEIQTTQTSDLLDPSQYLQTNLKSTQTTDLLDPYSYLNIETPTLQPVDQQDIDVTSYYPEGYENSWGNRFAIATDNMQASLYKGVDLIADITGAEGLKDVAQRGIQRNIKEAAQKPQPTRTASFTEGGKEIAGELKEGDVLGAIGRGLLLFKDMSAEVLPSMAPVLGGAVVGTVASAPLAAAGGVGAASAVAIRVLAPFIPGFLMGSGETYDEAKKLGVKEKDAQGWAVAGGATIGLLDKIGAAGILKGAIKSYGKEAVEAELKKAAPSVSKKQIKKILSDVSKKDIEKDIVKKHLLLEAGKKGADVVKTVTKQGLKAGGLEAGTEGLQELTQIAAAQAGGLTGENQIDFYTAPEVAKRVVDGAALGFVGGKTAGVGISAIGQLQQKNVDMEIEQENKIISELENNLPKNEKELLSEVKKRGTQAAPSLANKVFRTALQPLFDLSTKGEAGYRIYNALNKYYDDVSKDVGGFSEKVEAAFDLVRKDIKTPFARSISKLNNDQLFDVLYYGKTTKDKKIKEAARIIRRDILGEKLIDEISLNKASIMDQIKKGKQRLDETDKALNQTENLTETEINTLNKKVQDTNNSYNILKTFYEKKVKEINTDKKLNKKGKEKAIAKLDNNFLNKQYINKNGKKVQKDALNNLGYDYHKGKKVYGFQYRTGKGTIIQPVKATALFGTLANSGVRFDFRSDYFPRIFKFNNPFQWKKARKILMQTEVVDSKTKKKRKRTEDEANAIIDNIRGNDNVQDKKAEGLELEQKKKDEPIGPESQAAFENARRIDEETFKLLDKAGLVERNVKRIIDRYILQASQRNNIAKIKKIIDTNAPVLQANNQLTTWEAKRIKDIYDALQNRYNPYKNEGLNKLTRMMGTYQYMLTLPLAALTALSEPFIVLSRLGPQHAIYGISRATANAFRQALRSILPRLKKTKSEMEFRSILQGFDGTLAERLGDIAGISVSRRITDAFFKATLLTQVTQFSRDIAAQAITSQMRSDIKLITSKALQRQKNPKLKRTIDEVRAKKRLRELGLVDNNMFSEGQPLTQSNIFKWASGELEGTPPSLIRSALSKGVDDIIMAPNAINRPLWMSDPHFALVAQLKGFMFAFGSKVGMRMFREVVTPLFKGRIPANEAFKYGLALTMIIAVSLAVKELKDEIRYGEEESPYKRKEGWEHIRDGIISSNIFGPATPLYEMLRANQYGASPFGTALGPAFQWAENVTRALGDLALRDNPRQAIRQAMKAIPFVSAIRPTLPSEVADKFE